MNKQEQAMANACHAIFDVIVMNHSITSAADTHEVPISAMVEVARRILIKAKEAEYESNFKRRKSDVKGV